VDTEGKRIFGRHCGRNFSQTYPSRTYGKIDHRRVSYHLTYSLSQYMLINLGMSTNFGNVDTEHLPFPVTMSVDWIRVYQKTNAINYGCDPDDFPTQAYINECVSGLLSSAIKLTRTFRYIEAYTSKSPFVFMYETTLTVPSRSKPYNLERRL
jgi:hypothetical protein